MAREVESDVDRLLGCFERGVSQRSQHRRSGGGKQNTPSNFATTHLRSGCSEVASPEENVRTPQGKGYASGHHLVGGRLSAIASGEFRSSGRQISPGVFYGSPVGKPATKPPQLLRLLDDLRRDLAGENHHREVDSEGEFGQASASRTAVWATFPRQEQAIQFAERDANGKIVVFQYQDHVNGQRRFLATTYEEFWYRYNGMIPDYRHHYEIIQEDKPCHLYFDLEFNRRVNKEADGEAMVDLLLWVVQNAFLDIYGLKYDPLWTTELDSSTKDKFSRHLIIHAHQAAFKNNLHVGSFVGEICKRISQLRERNDPMESLFVLEGDSLATHHTKLFIDQGVYSRNRSFRLPFSSKAGKTAKLVPTNRFRCKFLGEMQSFMDSLICRVGNNCEKLLTYGQEGSAGGGTSNLATWKEKPISSQRRVNFCVSGRSPFPALDIFVESVACIGNVPGRIRSWYWFAEYGVVVYNISENRFCENIGRPHKSNNVMYIVDFRTAGYYQKCHDPDCRGYRSSLRPIPRHTVVPPEYPLGSKPEILYQEKDQVRTFDEEWEDETWWSEVISSMASLECVSESQPDTRNSLLDEEIKDEDWWCAVERELIELETRRTSPQDITDRRLAAVK